MNYRLALVLSFVLVLLPIKFSSGCPRPDSTVANQSQWILLTAPAEEFVAAVPSPPTVRSYPVYNNPREQREKILAHHEYGGYGDGLVYVIHSFEAEHPEKLRPNEFAIIDETEIFQRIQLGDVSADLFRAVVPTRDSSYTRHTVRFITGRHLYLISLSSIDDKNPSVDHFLSELRLRRSTDQETEFAIPEVTNSEAWNAKDVTRRAIIVWKDEPSYTDEARAHRVVGTVVLQAVFAEDGYVRNISVQKGLPHGLTEHATEAARSIRFFPAEKDGRRVGQRMMLEYNFDLY